MICVTSRTNIAALLGDHLLNRAFYSTKKTKITRLFHLVVLTMPFKVYFLSDADRFLFDPCRLSHQDGARFFFIFPLNHALYVRASNNFGFRGILSPVISLRIAHVPSPLREKGGCFLGCTKNYFRFSNFSCSCIFALREWH